MVFFPFLLAETAYKKTPQCHLGKRSLPAKRVAASLSSPAAGTGSSPIFPSVGTEQGWLPKSTGKSNHPMGLKRSFQTHFQCCLSNSEARSLRWPCLSLLSPALSKHPSWKQHMQ